MGEIWPDFLLRLFRGYFFRVEYGGGGGLDMVDAEEDPGDFENKGEALILNFPWVFLSAAVFIGIFLEGKISGA